MVHFISIDICLSFITSYSRVALVEIEDHSLAVRCE